MLYDIRKLFFEYIIVRWYQSSCSHKPSSDEHIFDIERETVSPPGNRIAQLVPIVYFHNDAKHGGFCASHGASSRGRGTHLSTGALDNGTHSSRLLTHCMRRDRERERLRVSFYYLPSLRPLLSLVIMFFSLSTSIFIRQKIHAFPSAGYFHFITATMYLCWRSGIVVLKHMNISTVLFVVYDFQTSRASVNYPYPSWMTLLCGNYDTL